MSHSCCVYGCKGKNSSKHTKLSVFKFPEDSELRKIWSLRTLRKNFKPTDGSRMCELHFRKKDIFWETEFFDEKSGELLQCSKLKEGAIPILFSEERPSFRRAMKRKKLYAGLVRKAKKKAKAELKRSVSEISFSGKLLPSMIESQLNKSIEIDSEQQPLSDIVCKSEALPPKDVSISENSSLHLFGEPIKTIRSIMHENAFGNLIEVKQEPPDDILYETSSSSALRSHNPIIVSVAPVLRETSPPSLTINLAAPESTEDVESQSSAIDSLAQCLGNKDLQSFNLINTAEVGKPDWYISESNPDNLITIKQEPPDDILHETNSLTVVEAQNPEIVSVATISTPIAFSPSHFPRFTESNDSNSPIIGCPAEGAKTDFHIEFNEDNLSTSSEKQQHENCDQSTEPGLLLKNFEKANLTQDTSNIGSDLSDFDDNTVSKRLRKKPVRYRCDSSTEDEQSEIETQQRKKKNLILTSPTSVEHSNATSEIRETRSIFSPESLVEKSTPRVDIENNKDDMPLRRIISLMFNSLEMMKKDIEIISKKQSEMNSQITEIKLMLNSEHCSNKEPYHTPEDVKFPISSDSELVNLNQRLYEDSNFYQLLVKYVSNVSYGKTLSSYTTNLLKKLITRDVACLYSRLGRKGKKSFEQLREVFNVILAAMSAKFPKLQREDLAERFGRVLACASEWDGCRIRTRPRISSTKSLSSKENKSL